MGNRFRTKAGESFARIVREYPLSPYVDQAKQRLKEMELPIPEADPVALNRMKYELENQQKPGMMDHALGIFKRGPDTKLAAKSGTPTMDAGRPAIPASIPVPAGEAGFQGDVTASTVTDSTALDTKPDARTAVPAQPAQQADTASPTPGNAAQAQQLPTNRQGKPPKQKKPKKGQPAPPAAPAEQTAPAVPAPAPTDSGAANLAPQK
jgi:outer membrane protein assembly factor BamD